MLYSWLILWLWRVQLVIVSVLEISRDPVRCFLRKLLVYVYGSSEFVSLSMFVCFCRYLTASLIGWWMNLFSRFSNASESCGRSNWLSELLGRLFSLCVGDWSSSQNSDLHCLFLSRNSPSLSVIGTCCFHSENDLVRCLTSPVIYSCDMCECKFGCKLWSIISRLIHEISPISSKMLIFYFNFAVGLWWVGSTRSKRYSKLFDPVNEVTVYGGWTIIMNIFLRYTIRYDAFFKCIDRGLSSCVSDRISS